MTLANGGPDAASTITVSDLLPAGVTYDSDTPSQGSYDDVTGVWTVGGVANGANATLDITVTVDAGTQGTIITNTASVAGADQADPAAGNNSDSVDIDVQAADLSISRAGSCSMP